MTNANVGNYTGLYFQKVGYGKIAFSSGIDLTNSGTTTFLQNLSSSLDMENGRIDLRVSSGSTASGSVFAGTPAIITMTLTGFPDMTSRFNANGIIIRDSLGTPLNASGLVSSFACSGSAGNQDCSFSTNHFTSFDLKPFLTSVHVQSDNAGSGSLARLGDTITVSFSGSESLAGLTVSMSGVANNTPLALTGSGNSFVAHGIVTTTGSLTPGFII